MDRQFCRNFFSAALSISLLSGCGAFEAQNEFSTLSEVSRTDKFDGTERPQCEVDFADYEIDTNLLAFEVTDKTNVSFGFNLLNGFFRALGFQMKLQRGKMVSAMHLRETLKPTMSVVDVLGTGESKEQEFKLDLNAVQLGIDLGYYYRTPLFQLTEKTLRGTLSNLRKELSAVETAWQSKVVWKKDNFEFIIPAGTVAGLRQGDRLKVYNIQYVWKENPCESELIMARKTTELPVAIAEIIQIEKNASLLKVIDSVSDAPIEIGSILEVHELKLANKKDKRALSRSVRIASIESQPLSVPGAKDVDLTIYLREQLSAVLSDYGLYPRQ